MDPQIEADECMEAELQKRTDQLLAPLKEAINQEIKEGKITTSTQLDQRIEEEYRKLKKNQ